MCPGFKATGSGGSMDAAALAAHSRFFDHLVDLVPAKYYLDSGEDKASAGGPKRRSGLLEPAAAGGGGTCTLLPAHARSTPPCR